MEVVWSFFGPKPRLRPLCEELFAEWYPLSVSQAMKGTRRFYGIWKNHEKSQSKLALSFCMPSATRFDRNKKTTSALVTKCRKVAAMRQAFFGALWPSSRCLFFVHPSVTLSMKTACAMQSQWLHVGTCNLPEIFRKANGRNHSGILWSWLEIILRNFTEHVLLRSQDAMMRLKIPIVTWCWPQIWRWPHSSRVSSQRTWTRTLDAQHIANNNRTTTKNQLSQTQGQAKTRTRTSRTRTTMRTMRTMRIRLKNYIQKDICCISY